MQRGNSSSKICFSWRFPLCYYYCFASEIRFVRVPLFFPFCPVLSAQDWYRSTDSFVSLGLAIIDLPGLTGYYWVVTGLLLGCGGFYRVLLRYTGFHLFSLGVLLGFTGFHLFSLGVLLGFTGFYWVLLGVT